MSTKNYGYSLVDDVDFVRCFDDLNEFFDEERQAIERQGFYFKWEEKVVTPESVINDSFAEDVVDNVAEAIFHETSGYAEDNFNYKEMYKLKPEIVAKLQEVFSKSQERHVVYENPVKIDLLKEHEL